MKWFLAICTLLGGGAGAWHYRDQLAAVFPDQARKPLRAKTVAHPPSDEETIYATGFVEGRRQTAELRFEIAGRLDKLLVAEGDKVQEGQVLAAIDSSVLKQQVVQAEANLESAIAELTRLQNAARPETRQVAQTQVEVARAEVARLEDKAARVKRLYDKSAASEDEWKEAYHLLQIARAKLDEKQALAIEVNAPARTDDVEVSKSRVEIARAALLHAKLQLEKTQLIAPCAGTILHVDCEQGELVGPSDSKPLFLFANLDTLRVRAYVEELHALKISVGDRAKITADGLPGETFEGTVVFRAPWMDEKQHRTHKPNELLDVRTREIVIELNQADQLVIGLPVEVSISPKTAGPLTPSSNADQTTPVTGKSNSQETPLSMNFRETGETPDFPKASQPLQTTQVTEDSSAEQIIWLGTIHSEHTSFKR